MHSEVGDVEAGPAGDDPDQKEDHGDERAMRRRVCRDVLEGRIQRVHVHYIYVRHNLLQGV